MGAGKGWSRDESVLACKSYQCASEDPRKGNGKKKEVFISQVLGVYKTLLANLRANNPSFQFPDRTGEAIVQRYRKARCECIKFEGIIMSIKARDPTGSPTEEQIERAALAIYNGEATLSQMYTYLTDRTMDVGTEFQFAHDLKFMRTTHTWDMILAAQSNRSAARTPSMPNFSTANNDACIANEHERGESESLMQSSARPTEEIESSEISQASSHTATATEVKRPMGTKRAMENTKQAIALHKGADAIEKMAEASRKRAKIAEEMLELDRKKSMIALFSMPGTNEAMRQEFVERSQLQALSELRKVTASANIAEGESTANVSVSQVATRLNSAAPNAAMSTERNVAPSQALSRMTRDEGNTPPNFVGSAPFDFSQK